MGGRAKDAVVYSLSEGGCFLEGTRIQIEHRIELRARVVVRLDSLEVLAHELLRRRRTGVQRSLQLGDGQLRVQPCQIHGGSVTAPLHTSSTSL